MAIDETHRVTATNLELLAKSAAGGTPRVGAMARGLVGSEILRIASEIRARIAAGDSVCNLTVGDFDPRQFPIPLALREGIVAALERGETNYPPSDGMPALRAAVRAFYARELGLQYPAESVLVAGGARPVIYAIYRALVDPGDRVLFPLPSWNNNHYIHMTGGEPVPLACLPEHRFLPTREDVVRELPNARLVCLNTPLNPSGTAMGADDLRGICEAILEENARRERQGGRAVFLMYDHIYWMLCAGTTAHVTPPQLLPEMARYTVFVDGISKAFAATGVRVGWAVGPTDVIERMSAILGHIGAWAPRAEQLASAGLLENPEAIREYLVTFLAGIGTRLSALESGLQAMKREGLAVDTLPPMGAIYLTARFHPFGKRTPAGVVLESNEDVRAHLLEAAGVGIVPFQAFGVPGESGWFRLSVGAASPEDIAAALPRIANALRALA